MASTTQTLPATMTTIAAKQSLGSGLGTILALDLGTLTGFALQTADGAIVSGTVSFRPSRYDGGGIRYLRFRGWLDSMAQDAAIIRRYVAKNSLYGIVLRSRGSSLYLSRSA